MPSNAETLTKHEIGKTPRENAMMDAEHSRSYSVRLKLAVENFLGGANKVLHFHVALPPRQERTSLKETFRPKAREPKTLLTSLEPVRIPHFTHTRTIHWHTTILIAIRLFQNFYKEAPTILHS